MHMDIWNSVKYLWWSFLAKIISGFKSLHIHAKNSIIDVYLGSKYTFGMFPSATYKVVAPLSGDPFHTQYEISALNTSQ